MKTKNIITTVLKVLTISFFAICSAFVIYDAFTNGSNL
ncbi:hypothetical protein AVT42_gp85 [Polaribacter phage P12002S]|uniref:Uncharacterized protein n=1 Tax=Polaribacter phage P12002S TaxID=1647387 RepID=A0A0F7DD36_9CAUD|nr:hypothetical protein AVT42_gp85 [Polaribacter phage P12002S]AKG94341.1 hypothetical protein P12002S_0085 [Polaribacter phage P12002S]